MPILLAMVESFVPPLPLIAIVALNVAAHGPVMGFLYSWCGVALGGSLMFTFWRRVVKRFFWRHASKYKWFRRAQKWVSNCDTSALFTLAMLPFTPTSFLHLTFGISDFDGRRYILTLLAGKAVMVAMMAIFGQSLTNALETPSTWCPPSPSGWGCILHRNSSAASTTWIDPPTHSKGPCRLPRRHGPLFLWVLL